MTSKVRTPQTSSFSSPDLNPLSTTEEISYALDAIEVPAELRLDRALVENQIRMVDAIFDRLTRKLLLIPILLAAVAGIAPARAQEIPEAPRPIMRAVIRPAIPVKKTFLSRTEWALLAMDVAGRAGDWTSTEECQRRPLTCRETELPQSFVSNKAGLAAFELADLTTNLLLAHLFHVHHHDRLAMIGQSIEVVCITSTVIRNYGGPSPAKSSPIVEPSKLFRAGGVK